MSTTYKPAPPDPNEVCDKGTVELASISVALPGGGRLVFCNHHYDELSLEAKISVPLVAA